jgi:hypothetical protein
VDDFGFKTRKEDNERRREEWQSRMRRGGDPPPLPAALGGKSKATPEEIKRWVTYLPGKPPGRE